MMARVGLDGVWNRTPIAPVVNTDATRRLARLAAAGALAAVPAVGRAQATCAALYRDEPAAAAVVTTQAPPLDRAVPGTAPATPAVPLRDALDQLAAAARVRLSYSRELLPLDRPSCPTPARTTLGTALARLLAGTGVQAVGVGDDQVVLAPTLRPAAEEAPAPTSPRLAVLEQVVVTGSATGAPSRRLPFALDVVDGAALGAAAGGGSAGLSAAALAGTLDGRVPGLWLWAQPPTAVLTRYGSLRGASSFGVTTPKLYLDGVEVANPLVVTDLPADRIARVEVIRGPQGAALYGADAISGVINVVTRHDGATSGSGAAHSFTVRGGVGGAGSDFVGRPAVSQDYGLALRAGTGARTGGASLTATSLGAYAPGAASRRLTATADARAVGAAGTLTASLRLADAVTSSPGNPLLSRLLATPAYGSSGPDSGSSVAGARVLAAVRAGAVSGTPKLCTDTGTLAGAELPRQRLRQLTVGGTFTRAGTSRWTHAVTAGVDAYGLSGVATELAPVPTPLDSAQRAARGGAARGTLRASSTATFDLRPGLRATVLGLADYGLLRDATADGAVLAVDGCAPVGGSGGPGRPLLGRRGGSLLARAAESAAYLSTTGLVAQGTLVLRDALFVTAGVRGEHNTGFTPASRLAALPSVGVALVRTAGSGATVKLRTAYGSGLRPARTASRATTFRGAGTVPDDLAPEAQRGIEGGVDVYLDVLGGRGAGGPVVGLHATAFDQQATNLLQQVLVAPPTTWAAPRTALDSARRRPRGLAYALENVGVIRNHGLELAGDLRAGPLTLAATYALVDSRVRRLASGYTGDLRAGDRMLEVPRHTAGLSAAWQQGPWSASLGAARAGDWINYDRLALAADASNPTVPTRNVYGSALRRYWRQYDGVTRMEATAARAVRSGLTVVVSGANLLDRQQGEPDNATLVPGRSVTLGVRARF
jgi:iron complex outermembrane receptor protein